MKISKIILYDEPTVPEIQIEKIKKFIIDTFNIKVEKRGNFFEKINNETCKKIASTRIFDLKNRYKKHMPSTEEIQVEKENKDMSKEEIMTIYDGFELQNIIIKNIPITGKVLHIILTNKITATFDESDFRYHARALISSNPTIISTTGIIEAPAKPKKYYLELMTSFSKDKIKEIREKYQGEFLEYHDLRLNEIIEGYLLQSIVYYKTGEIFCKDRNCRLFNAHWQKDLLHSQIENKTICQKHMKIINQIKNE